MAMAGGDTPLGLFAFAVAFGVGSGAGVALVPVVVADGRPADQVQHLVPVLYTAAGFGGLAGMLTAGPLLDSAAGYQALFTLGLFATLLAAALTTDLSSARL